MSDMAPRKRLRAGDADRDAVLQVLQQAHAEGRLSVEEMVERQDQVLRAEFLDEFAGVVEHLREERDLVAVNDAASAVRCSSPPPATGASERTSVTFLSSRDIKIQPGTRRYQNFAWWGGGTIDLTSAMGPGVVITLELHAFMAGYNICVPTGVQVLDESLQIGIMGLAGSDVNREASGDGSNGTVILKGFLWWAGHKIQLGSTRPS